MLMAIRDRFTGIIAWGVVILISIPFALWGIQEYMNVGQDNYALKINGTEISVQDYEREYELSRRNLMQSFGGKIPPYFDETELLRKQTVDRLIERELLRQASDEFAMRVSETKLAENIMQIQAFQREGGFDQALYQQQLQSIGRSKRGFEQEMSAELVATQLSQGINASAFTTQHTLTRIAALKHQLRDFDYVVLPTESYRDAITITEDEIKQYYDTHLSDFVTEERVTIEYLELDQAAIAAAIKVDEAVLQRLYEEGEVSGALISEETRAASHILLRVPQDADVDTVAAKRAEIEDLRARLEKGESFAELAKHASDDPGSATQGGSLGEVNRGIMVKPFEDVLFAMTNEGEISEPVKTTFGFHIIKLDKINPQQKKTFAQVRNQLEQDYRSREAEKAFSEKKSQLANIAFENGESLQPAADALGLKIQTVENLERFSGAGIASNPQVRDTAFSDEVLHSSYNSDPIEIASGRVVVLRVKRHVPSAQKSLAEAHDQVESVLRQEALDENLALAAQELMALAADKGLNEEVARQFKGQYRSVKDIKRENSELPREVVSAAFKLQAPQSDSQSIIDKARLQDGSGYAVIALQRVQQGDIAWVENEQKQRLRQQLTMANGNSDYQAVLANLKQQAKITINPEIR